MIFKMKISALVIFIALTAAAFPPDDEGVVRTSEVDGLAGESVHLPCQVDPTTCGNFHSLKWYFNQDRIYIYSNFANVKRSEGLLLGRTDLHFSENGSETSLEISRLQTTDEGMYKCEITYLSVRDQCSVVQMVNLTTFAMPTYLQMSFDDKTPIDNGTMIGPFDEMSMLTLMCESGGGKPVARVSWLNNSQPLAGQSSSTRNADGTGVGTSILQTQLTRSDLGTSLSCKVDHETLATPYISTITVDVHVPPEFVEISGPDVAMEGDVVTLKCVVKGARPPATITWLNGSVPIEDAETIVNLQEDINEHTSLDGTFETHSRLNFEVTKYENGQSFSCEATNTVLANRNEKPLSDTFVLDVHFAPVVIARPDNITVNETVDILILCEYIANPPELTHLYWYKNGGLIDIAGNPEKYGDGVMEAPNLLVMNSTADDGGNYTCEVGNVIGTSEAEESVQVNVLYVAEVQVVIEPVDTFSESNRQNATLICEVLNANPRRLTRTRWYLNDGILKEIPECFGNYTSIEEYLSLCKVPENKLVLEYVFRDFHGNYTCEGMNEAGWGPRSNAVPLTVYYPPEQALITYDPPIVIKGQSLELTCNLDDPGNPETTEFKWYRGSRLVSDQTSATWTINPVSLETDDEFTCVPFNSDGEGFNDTVKIDVLAPPLFINRLPHYHGELMNAAEVSLTCRVECSPLCNITWLKDDLPMNNMTHYTITEKTLPANPYSGDFESAMSTLTWQMDRWPDGVLDRHQDIANYTCTSSSNVAGPGVTSHTYFRVEYPPEDITVSEPWIQVVEGEVLPKTDCFAASYPEPMYVWQYGDETVSTGSVLNLNYAIEREKAGTYTCVAENRHGKMIATTTLDVLFRPECKIDRLNKDEGQESYILLICRAEANPEEVTFRWRNQNETLTQDVTSEGLESRLRIPASSESIGTYYCYVNNSVGESIPCEIDVTALGQGNIFVTVGIVVGIVLLLIVICIIIIIVCRRYRQAGKLPNSSANNLQEREKPERISPSPASTTPAPGCYRVHRWPIRPGVHVHINNISSLIEDDDYPLVNSKKALNPSPLNNPNLSLPPPSPASSRDQKTPKDRQTNYPRVNSTSGRTNQDHPPFSMNRSSSGRCKNNALTSATLRRTSPNPSSRQQDVSSSSTPSPTSPTLSFKRRQFRNSNHTGVPDGECHTNYEDPGRFNDPSSEPPQDNGAPSAFNDDYNPRTYTNLPFLGRQSPPNQDPLEEHNAPATEHEGDLQSSEGGGIRPPSRISHQASSGYGSAHSRKDMYSTKQSCVEESQKDALKHTRRQDVMLSKDAVQGEKERTSKIGSSHLQSQDPDSRRSMRNPSEKASKNALARTAAYLSVRFPRGHKRKFLSKGSCEEDHQMIDSAKNIRAIPPKDSQSHSSPHPEIETDAQTPDQQTTRFTSETKHTVFPNADHNTIIVESTQTSKLTVLTRPPSRAGESNNNSTYPDGYTYGQGATNQSRNMHLPNRKPYADPENRNTSGYNDTLPKPAPRNGVCGKVKHTYQNIPYCKKNKNINNAQQQQQLQQQQQHQQHPSLSPVLIEDQTATATYDPSHLNPSRRSSPPSYSNQGQILSYDHPQGDLHHPQMYQYPASVSHRQGPPVTPRQMNSSAVPPPNGVNGMPHSAPSHSSFNPNMHHPIPYHPKYSRPPTYVEVIIPDHLSRTVNRRENSTEYTTLRFSKEDIGNEIDV